MFMAFPETMHIRTILRIWELSSVFKMRLGLGVGELCALGLLSFA